jgi:17beta-estradiol 17-dehydrogenase / very-long-chain 3-oxoacyl-CoA reductase
MAALVGSLSEFGVLGVILFVVGLYKVGRWLLGLLYILLLKRLLPSNIRRYLKPNAWAVVTGCTDGIGREFATQLAKKGFNIVLLSRTQSKLDDVAKLIAEETNGKVSTQSLAVDFEKPRYDDIAALLKKLSGPVTVLINNVGISYDYPERFLELEEARVNSLVALNIETVNHMTRIVAKDMVDNKCGLVVNIGTGGSFAPSPLLAAYAASKIYVSYLASALAFEYAGKGVHFETLEPLFVVSKLSKVRKSFMNPTAFVYVRSAIGQIGRQSTPHAGFWVHDLALYLMRSVPLRIAMGQARSMHEGIRKRAIAKKEREAIAAAPATSGEGKTTPRRR